MSQTQINQIQPSLSLWNIPQITVVTLNPFMDLIFMGKKKKNHTLLLLHKIELSSLYLNVPLAKSICVSWYPRI